MGSGDFLTREGNVLPGEVHGLGLERVERLRGAEIVGIVERPEGFEESEGLDGGNAYLRAARGWGNAPGYGFGVDAEH